MFALATTAIAWVIFAAVALFWVAYYFANRNSARAELGSEIELAPNRKPYYSDEELEGPKLNLALFSAAGLLALIGVALPRYLLPAYGLLFVPESEAAEIDQAVGSWHLRQHLDSNRRSVHARARLVPRKRTLPRVPRGARRDAPAEPQGGEYRCIARAPGDDCIDSGVERLHVGFGPDLRHDACRTGDGCLVELGHPR